MATHSYKLIDGQYQEIGDEEIDDIQNQQNTNKLTNNDFNNWILPSKNEYTYSTNGSSYDVTNLVKSEYEKETQNLSEKYGTQLSNINTDFDTAKKDLDTAREKELQTEYIVKEKQLDILPSTLAQTGLDGGASQTESMKIETGYQGARDEIEGFFSNELGKLIKERDEQLRKEQEEYEQMMAAAAKSYESDLTAATTKSSSSKTVTSEKPENLSNNIKLPVKEKTETSKKIEEIVNEIRDLFM